MKSKYFILSVLCACILCACDETIKFDEYEDIPQVAAEILGMRPDDAIAYLQKRGYNIRTAADLGDCGTTNGEYAFSKDPSQTAFSTQSSIVIMFGTFYTDTVRYVSGLKRMETTESAVELYDKWSKYVFKKVMPKPYLWRGSIWSNNVDNSYSQGRAVDEEIANLKARYANGEIAEEEYQMWLESYANDRKKFEQDYEAFKPDIKSVNEDYHQFDLDGVDTAPNIPKEIEMYYDPDNDGRVELYFSITNFITHWE